MHRWTIRGIDPDVIDMVHEVAASSEMTIGEVVNAAVTEWYEGLPTEHDAPHCHSEEPEMPVDPSVVRRVWFVHDPVFEEISELPSDSSDPDTKRPSESQRLATRT